MVKVNTCCEGSFETPKNIRLQDEFELAVFLNQVERQVVVDKHVDEVHQRLFLCRLQQLRTHLGRSSPYCVRTYSPHIMLPLAVVHTSSIHKQTPTLQPTTYGTNLWRDDHEQAGGDVLDQGGLGEMRRVLVAQRVDSVPAHPQLLIHLQPPPWDTAWNLVS